MTRSLAWKELREQWAVWLTMAVAAVAGVLGFRSLMGRTSHFDQLLVWVLWLGTWGYGLVCGALLFAGETEDGTQPFLDVLPGSRRRLWRAKALTGLLLLAAQAALLAAVGYFLFGNKALYGEDGTQQVGIFALGVTGYAFGLYGGSLSATVLGGIGRGVLAQAVIGMTLLPFFAAAPQRPFSDPGWGLRLFPAAVAAIVAVAAAAVRSRQVYCRADRLRDFSRRRPAARPATLDWEDSLRRAWWDARWFALGMAVVALLALAAAVLKDVHWSVTTSLIGLVCGLSASAGSGGDRSSGTPQLLARACVRFAIGLAATSLTILIPLGVLALLQGVGGGAELQALVRRLQAESTGVPPAHAFALLPAWLTAGFAVGLLCGFFAPGSAAAGLLAVPGAGVLVALLAITGSAKEMTALEIWCIPTVLLALAAVAMWLRSDSIRAERAQRPDWDESLRRAWWDARWFALGMAAAALLARAATILADVRWSVTTSLIGLICGLSASVVVRGERRFPTARQLLTRAFVRLAIGLAATSLTVLVPVILVAVVPARLGGADLQVLARRLQAESAALTVANTFAPLEASLLNGFAVGLLCGFIAPGSVIAGLLAVPGACFLWLLPIAGPVRAMPLVEIWLVPAVLLAVAALAAWVRSGPNHSLAEKAEHPGWDESLRRACWDARWFAVGAAAVGALAIAAETASGFIAWSITMSFVGFACGLTAAAIDRAIGRRPPEGRHLIICSCVYFAVALGTAALAMAVPSVLYALTQDVTPGNLARIRVNMFRGITLTPPSPALVPGGVFNGFVVGLLCGLYARGSRIAGLLAVPAACFLGSFLLTTEVAGGSMNAWQAWGVPAIILAAGAASKWVAAGGKAAPLRSGAAVTAGALLAILWWVTVS